MLPTAFSDFGKSLVSAAAFVSNMYFWRSTNYFTAPVDSIPLLHTWSLSVEKAILYYRAGAYVRRLPLRPARIVAMLRAPCVGVIRTECSGRGVQTGGDVFPPADALLEMALGSLLAFGAAPTLRSTMARNAVALIGSCGHHCSDAPAAIPISRFRGGTHFRLACSAAALLAYGRETLVGRVFQQRIPVSIGLISYSLYLLALANNCVLENEIRSGNCPSTISLY